MSSRIPGGSIALVTGSSSGFGLLACLELARRGLRVFASMRDLGRADRLEGAARARGLAVEPIQLDVTDPGSIARALAEIGDRVPGAAVRPPVDVLVNNAGFGMAGFIEDLTMAELREQLETNFFGLVAVTKAVIPGMRERRRGRIINVSSVAGRLAQPGLGAYAASKFAVEGVSEALRHELLPHGVYVVVVEPGSFRTEIFGRNRRVGQAVFDGASPNHAASRRLEALVGRLAGRGDPNAVARVIADVAMADRPRLRYLVGGDARAVDALRAALPFSVWERAFGRLLRAGER